MKSSKLFVLFLSFISSASAFAIEGAADAAKCARRVRDAGCYLSNNDFDRIEDNVAACKQANDDAGRIEVFLLKNADKVVVVKTSPVVNQYCKVTKYSIDSRGIKTIKVIGNSKIGERVFMLANSGRVYFMESDQDVYEVLNSKGKSYSNVAEIKGADSGKAVHLIGERNSFDVLLTREALWKKIRDRELRKIDFTYYTTERSLFRDE